MVAYVEDERVLGGQPCPSN